MIEQNDLYNTITTIVNNKYRVFISSKKKKNELNDVKELNILNRI